MTKEQAIENLEEIIGLVKDEINQDDKNITAFFDLTDLKSLKTVLSMLKEKDIELIETKEANRQLSVELENKDKQIEQYMNILATNDMSHVKECEEKDEKIEKLEEIKDEAIRTCFYEYNDDTEILCRKLAKNGYIEVKNGIYINPFKDEG